jgi:porin
MTSQLVRAARVGAFCSIGLGVSLLSARPVSGQTAEPGPPAPQSATAEDLLKQPELTGNWGGARERLLKNGTRIEASLTQFFDWAPEGDDDRGFDYGGKVDLKVKSDLSNHLWKGFSADGHFELRYGDVPLLSGGTLIPTSTALLFPESEGTHAKLSSLYGTQVFENRYVLQFGRFNTLDLYSAHPFTGGEGINRFMNLSLVAPPVSARTVPPSGEGVLFSVLKGTVPALTLGLIESTEEGFFENGATFLWSAGLPVRFSSTLPGGVLIGGEFSSFEGTSLDQNPWVFLPSLDIEPAIESGTWTFNVTVDQYLWMHPNDPRRGLGVFGMFAVSDGNPSFLRRQAFVGLGGASPFEGRSADSWGAAFFYNDVSDDLENTVERLLPIRNELGAELFYSWAPVGWSRVTADLQLVDPFLLRSETRVFFALRWKVIF